MIRIVHVISDLDTGGAEIMLTKLVMGLDRNRFSSIVVSLTDRGQLGQQIESSGVAVYTLGMKRGRPDFRALPRLVKLLKMLKPAIVHSWLYHADLLCALAIRWHASPILVWNVRCSDMNLEHYPLLTRIVRRALAWQSSIPAAVVVNSEAGRVQHERLGYHPRRWVNIPNGFDTRRFVPDPSKRIYWRREWKLSEDAVVVALIARVDPMKDHTTFIEAIQLVAKARANARFVFVGKGTDTLIRIIEEKGLTDFTCVFGYRNDVAALLPAIDIVCLSSAFGEGFPNVLGEAMSCGVPCVSTDVGDARSIIDDTGKIVPVRNAEALADAIVDLIDRGSDERASLGRAARLRITNKYSLPKVIDMYATFFSEVATVS